MTATPIKYEQFAPRDRPGTAVAVRYLRPTGAKFPQFCVGLWPGEGGVTVGVSCKAGVRDWWEPCTLLDELVPELIDLLRTYHDRVKT